MIPPTVSLQNDIPYISRQAYKPTPVGRIWDLFGLKTGIHFAYFGLESGMVFERTTGACEHSYRFNK